LSFENVGRYQFLYLLAGFFFKRLVTLQADSEPPVLTIQVKCFNHLFYLLFWSIGLNQDGFKALIGNYSSFHNLGIPGQYHPVFSQSSRHHLTIVTTFEEQSVIAHHPQPLGQFADIYINYKL